MKKQLFLSLLALTLSFGLSSCGGSSPTESPATENPTETPVTVTPTETPTSEDLSEYYTLPEGWENETMKCSYGDDLIDIAVDKALITGLTYTFSYTLSDISYEYSTGSSSNEKVFTVEQISDGCCRIHPVHKGEAYFTVMDSNMLVRYRHKVIVMDPMEYDDIVNYMTEDVEYWTSVALYGDEYNMTFLYDNQVAISGYITGEAFDAYTATYKLTKETDAEYQFEFTDDQSAELSLTGFNIAKCGDFMYLMDKWGAAAIMLPNDREIDF